MNNKRSSKTKMPSGISKHPNGGFKIDTTATCPHTKKRIRVRETLPSGTTLKQAIARRNTIKEDILNRPPQDEPQIIPQRLTLAGYANAWLQRKAPRLKPNTLHTYGQIITEHIIPPLGTLYADAVIRADIEEWVVWAESQRQASDEHYSDATLKKWWTTLTVLLKDMAADINIPDPTLRISRPTSRRRKVREKRTLTFEQLGMFLEAVRTTPAIAHRYAEILTLAYTGLRVGELYGLKWDDLDETRRVLNVCRSVSSGQLTETTKTGDAREVAVPDEVIDVLVGHRRQMILDQHRGLATGLMFPSKANTPRTNSSLTKPIRTAASKAGLDIIPSPQVLRRTYNTLMVRAGVDRIVLRSQIGHVSEEMTARYMGVSDEDKHDAVARVLNMEGFGST